MTEPILYACKDYICEDLGDALGVEERLVGGQTAGFVTDTGVDELLAICIWHLIHAWWNVGLTGGRSRDIRKLD